MFGPGANEGFRANAICACLFFLLMLSILLPILSPVIAIGAGGFTPAGMIAAGALFVCSTFPVLMNIVVFRRDNDRETENDRVV